jgi:protein-L-isoaspartate(D-aspartate) O-methyltransferase
MTSQPAGDPRATHLVDRLEIQDARVRAALLKVPRDRFVPAEEHATAYDDTPVPLGVPGATASAPHMAVLQLEAAQLAPGQKVLEIGGGMGYLGALIAELVAPGGSVDLVELDAHLVSEARQRLAAWSPPAPVRVHAGDGSAGWPGGAPYDRILASCQTPAAPRGADRRRLGAAAHRAGERPRGRPELPGPRLPVRSAPSAAPTRYIDPHFSARPAILRVDIS